MHIPEQPKHDSNRGCFRPLPMGLNECFRRYFAHAYLRFVVDGPEEVAVSDVMQDAAVNNGVDTHGGVYAKQVLLVHHLVAKEGIITIIKADKKGTRFKNKSYDKS